MLENRIKFKHLHCFVEVARQGNVSRAAQILALTQPAVSKKIKELEEMLGAPLLERGRHGMALTSFGKLFLHYAGMSLSALREGAQSIVQAQASGKKSLAVGVLPTVAARILPGAVKRFYQLNLGVTLNLFSGPNALLLDQLRLGELDFVVGRLADPQMVAGLSFTHLYSEPVMFVVRPGHPLLAQSPFNQQAIGQYPVLFPTRDSIIARAAEQFLISQGIMLSADRIETISSSFGKEFVLQTDAVWIISGGVVAREISQGALMALPLDTKETLGAVGLTTRADAVSSPAASLLMDCIRDTAADLAQD